MKSESYKPCHCGADCGAGNDTEICWGEVNAVDEWQSEEDWGWIHRCEGHDIDTNKYTPE